MVTHKPGFSFQAAPNPCSIKTETASLWSLLLSVTAVHAQSNYRVSSGDTLSIEVLEDPQLNREVQAL